MPGSMQPSPWQKANWPNMGIVVVLLPKLGQPINRLKRLDKNNYLVSFNS